MGHRRELKNIARGIISSFTSRNNDVNGYWELGKLYKFCEVNHRETIQLDLLNLETEPKSEEFMPLTKMWKSKLDGHLKSRHIPISWISSAIVIAKFNQEYTKEYHYWGAKLGDHCTCICEITSDNGRVYSVTAGTNCTPHNPKKECRSARRNDL